MPILCIPNPLRPYVAGQSEVSVSGQTVGAAMDDLMRIYPGFRMHLYKPDGSLRAFVNLFVMKTNIRDLQGLETPLGPEDVVQLVPAIAGG